MTFKTIKRECEEYKNTFTKILSNVVSIIVFHVLMSFLTNLTISLYSFFIQCYYLLIILLKISFSRSINRKLHIFEY